jgi:hypothetical protein
MSVVGFTLYFQLVNISLIEPDLIPLGLSCGIILSWCYVSGLFMKDFQLDIEKAFRNVGKLDHKNESVCKSSHVVPSGGRSVKHMDIIESPAQAIMLMQVSVVVGRVEYNLCVLAEGPVSPCFSS